MTIYDLEARAAEMQQVAADMRRMDDEVQKMTSDFLECARKMKVVEQKQAASMCMLEVFGFVADAVGGSL